MRSWERHRGMSGRALARHIDGYVRLGEWAGHPAMTGDPPEKVMTMGVPPPSFEDLGRALAAVGSLIDEIRPEQWSAATPCTEWTVRNLVTHLVGANLIFAAI